MASQAMPTMEDDMEEGNAFTAALAKTPKGGKFAVGGKTFTDRTGYDAKVNEYAFESLDKQLNALLNESEEVSEGLSVSISKGQQNSPDSVTITAQDQEAEHLLAFVKNAGLGLFGDDNADAHSSAMSVQPSHGAPDEVGAGGIDIGVVDGHDGMMGLMQKLSGIQSVGADDYADEEGDEEQLYGNHQAADKKDCGCDGDCECSDYDQPSNEATCNECGTYEGMHEAGCSMGRGKEMVDEVEDDEDHDEWHDKDGNVDPSGAHDAAGHYYRDRDQVDGNQLENAGMAEQDSHGHVDHFESNTVEVVQQFIEHTSEPHVSYPTETPVSTAATYSPAPTFTSEAAAATSYTPAPASTVTAEAPAVEPKYTQVDSHTHSTTSTHHEHDHSHDHKHDDQHAHAESSTVEAAPTPAPVFVPTPVAVTPAPSPAPVSAPTPAPVAQAVSQQSLDEVLKSAGLTMAVTNPDKLRQVQEASTVSAPTVRTPRERKPLVSAPSEPLVQIETQR
jgi:hypothetical protein